MRLVGCFPLEVRADQAATDALTAVFVASPQQRGSWGRIAPPLPQLVARRCPIQQSYCLQLNSGSFSPVFVGFMVFIFYSDLRAGAASIILSRSETYSCSFLTFSLCRNTHNMNFTLSAISKCTVRRSGTHP